MSARSSESPLEAAEEAPAAAPLLLTTATATATQQMDSSTNKLTSSSTTTTASQPTQVATKSLWWSSQRSLSPPPSPSKAKQQQDHNSEQQERNDNDTGSQQHHEEEDEEAEEHDAEEATAHRDRIRRSRRSTTKKRKRSSHPQKGRGALDSSLSLPQRTARQDEGDVDDDHYVDGTGSTGRIKRNGREDANLDGEADGEGSEEEEVGRIHRRPRNARASTTAAAAQAAAAERDGARGAAASARAGQAAIARAAAVGGRQLVREEDINGSAHGTNGSSTSRNRSNRDGRRGRNGGSNGDSTNVSAHRRQEPPPTHTSDRLEQMLQGMERNVQKLVDRNERLRVRTNTVREKLGMASLPPPLPGGDEDRDCSSSSHSAVEIDDDDDHDGSGSDDNDEEEKEEGGGNGTRARCRRAVVERDGTITTATHEAEAAAASSLLSFLSGNGGGVVGNGQRRPNGHSHRDLNLAFGDAVGAGLQHPHSALAAVLAPELSLLAIAPAAAGTLPNDAAANHGLPRLCLSAPAANPNSVNFFDCLQWTVADLIARVVTGEASFVAPFSQQPGTTTISTAEPGKTEIDDVVEPGTSDAAATASPSAATSAAKARRRVHTRRKNKARTVYRMALETAPEPMLDQLSDLSQKYQALLVLEASGTYNALTATTTASALRHRIDLVSRMMHQKLYDVVYGHCSQHSWSSSRVRREKNKRWDDSRVGAMFDAYQDMRSCRVPACLLNEGAAKKRTHKDGTKKKRRRGGGRDDSSDPGGRGSAALHPDARDRSDSSSSSESSRGGDDDDDSDEGEEDDGGGHQDEVHMAKGGFE